MSKSTEISERQQLAAEYLDLAKKELPLHIKQLPISSLRLAIQQARVGVVFGDLKQATAENPSSLMEWDSQDEKNSNAYGS